MFNMKKRIVINYIEDILRRYPGSYKRLQDKQATLYHNGVLTVTIEEDKKLVAYENYYLAVTNVIQEAGNITMKIINEVYFNGNRKIEELDVPINLATSLRDRFCMQVAQELSLPGFWL